MFPFIPFSLQSQKIVGLLGAASDVVKMNQQKSLFYILMQMQQALQID